MIQINCTTNNVASPAVLVTSDGQRITALVESASRSIFKITAVLNGATGNFVDANGNILFSNYSIPSIAGSYEGPVLNGIPLTPTLHIQRDQFIDENGNNYNWHGHIDWMLYKRSLDGVTIEPLLDQRYAAGSRAVATLMQAFFIEDFNPAHYGQQFYDHAVPFANALRAKGFLWMPVVYADEQQVKSGHDFVYKLAEVFNGMNWVFPSLGNESQKNGFDPANFDKPNTSNFWSRGSSVSDTAPYYPSWDWKEWHARRDWPKVLFGNDDAWYVKEGINANAVAIDNGAKPCIISEPIGFWNQIVDDRRSNDPNLARVVGVTSCCFARGANFMSEQGLLCTPWDEVTNECAVAFFKSINQF